MRCSHCGRPPFQGICQQHPRGAMLYPGAWVGERSFARKRCVQDQHSNYQCLLKQGHKGDHCPPCVDSGKHSAHAKAGSAGRFLLDAKGKPYMCSGRTYDQT